jgi:hypothetical protein
MSEKGHVQKSPRPSVQGLVARYSDFFFFPTALIKWTPASLPLTHASSHRRYAFPTVENTRKNSVNASPCIEPSIESLAPVSDASSIVQGRRQVPSIAIMLAANPFSNTTRFALRWSTMSRFAEITIEIQLNEKPAGDAPGGFSHARSR